MDCYGRKWVDSRQIGRRHDDFYVREKNNDYRNLFYLGQIITSETQLDKLLDTIMIQVNNIMSTQRSTVFLYDKVKDELWSLVATGIDKSEIRIPSNSGIAGWVFYNKTPIISNRAYDDECFNPEIDKKTGFHTHKVICVPLINRKKKCIGTIEVLNKKTKDFDEDDVTLLKAISDYVTIALENAKYFEKMKVNEQALRKSEEKYRTMIQSIVDGYFEVDLAGNMKFFNDSMCRILGYSAEEMVDINNRTYMDSKTSKMVYETFHCVYETRVPTKAFGWELIRKDGEIRYVETSVSLIEDSAGVAVGFRGITRDITELRAFEKAKERVVNHLSHELGTPIAIIDAAIARMPKEVATGNTEKLNRIERRIHRNVQRLRELQDIIYDIVKGKAIEPEEKIINIVEGALTMLDFMKDENNIKYSEILQSIINELKAMMSINNISLDSILICTFLNDICNEASNFMENRKVAILQYYKNDQYIEMDESVLRKVCGGILRNAIENTPDEGIIEVRSKINNEFLVVEFIDYGVGISHQNQKMIFGGFFHTQDTNRYSSKSRYDFNAGGWGTDLLRAKVLSERFGFGIGFSSKRCRYLPLDSDECIGRISACPFIRKREDCLHAGGSTFTLQFPLSTFSSLGLE